MKSKFLLSILCIICLQFAFGQGNYLLPRFEDEVVNLKVHSSGLYLDHTPSTTNPFVGQNYAATNWNNQQWEIVTTDQATWYRIRHVNSSKYLTVPDNRGDGAWLEMQNLGYGNDPGNSQLFQFVLQNCTSCTDMYKIHTKYAAGGGYDYVVQLPASDNNVGTQPRMGKNITVGNDDHQEFSLASLYPDDNPSGSPGNLANRFENRTSGITAVFNGWELLGSTNHNRLYEQPPTPGIIADEEWKIEYSNETGWFRIRNKLQNKYVTVTGVEGETMLLQNSYGNSDPRQKFKFVQQVDGDDVYKIFSRYSVGSPGRALVLNIPTTATIDITLAKNKQTNGYNQKVKLTLDIPPGAQFTSGAPSEGSGKILQKQYYVSGFESLALLEPYVVGTDTFIRVQPNPVYGTQSEWTFDDGGTVNGIKSIRIRYGKTNQYLFLPVANENADPYADMRLKLKADTGHLEDKRYKFSFDDDGSIEHSSYLLILAGTYNANQCQVNDDGFLTAQVGITYTYKKNQKFLINLSLPLSDTFNYAITTKANGHFLSDSGIDIDNSRLVHSLSATPATLWNFINQGNGYYKIKSTLTRNYVVSGYGNGGGAGTEIHTSTNDGTGDGWQWALERSNNYYHIRNKGTGKYFSLYNYPNPGNPVYNGLVTDPGTEWAITRADYVKDPLLLGFNSEMLLENYAPVTGNVFTQDSIKNKLIKNIGLPFNPSYSYPLTNLLDRQQTFLFTGIPYSPAPDFYAVVRSALAWKFGWSSTRIDSAMKNYKFVIPGHRVQVVYALREYILEYLAPRTDRSTWTYNERELVAYIERKIKKLKEGYAGNVEENWKEVKDETQYQNSLYFNSIMGLIPNPDNYQEPDYYRPDSIQSGSLTEYQAICATRNFKNPNVLASVIAPAISVAGSFILTSVPLNFALVNLLGKETLARLTLRAAYALAKFSGELAGKFLGQAITDSYEVFSLIATVSSVGGLSGMVSVAIMLLQGIIQYGQEGEAYTNFDNYISTKVTALRTTPVNISTTMNGNNTLNKYNMCQDFDFILATGERFDDDTHPNIATFNGNGNWSDPANWSNNAVPPNPLLSLNPTISIPDAIMINPIIGGKCIIDINLDASPLGSLQPPPIHVMAGKTLQIKAGVTFKVEDLYIRKP